MLSEPQIFTRERLVNDRLREERWLLHRLDLTDQLLDQGRFREYQSASSSSKDLKVSVEVQGPSDAPAAQAPVIPPESSSASGTTAGPPGHLTAQGVALSPMSEFRRAETYRDEIRDMLMSTQLDDRHDIKGNTLIRLSFSASVLAGSPGQNAALIYVEARPGYAAGGYEEQYSETLNEWQDLVQQQIDQNLQSTSKALISAVSPEVLASPQIKLLRWYVRSRFVEKISEDNQVFPLLQAWPVDDLTIDRSKHIKQRLRERAQVLHDFYVGQYVQRIWWAEYREYALTVEGQLRALISAIRADKTPYPPAPGMQPNREERVAAVATALGIIDFCKLPEDKASDKCSADEPRMSSTFYKRVVASCYSAGKSNQTYSIPISLEAASAYVSPTPGPSGPPSARPTSFYSTGGSQSQGPGNSNAATMAVSCPPQPLNQDQARLLGSIMLLRKVIPTEGSHPTRTFDFLSFVLREFASWSKDPGSTPCSLHESDPEEKNSDKQCKDTYPVHQALAAYEAEVRGTVADFIVWEYRDYTSNRLLNAWKDDPEAWYRAEREAVHSTPNKYVGKYFDIRLDSCPSLSCTIRVSKKPGLFFGRMDCANIHPNEDKPLYCTLMQDLESDARMYAYTMTPSEVSASEIASAESRKQLAARLGMALEPSVKTGASGEASSGLASQLALSPPTLIAFSSPLGGDETDNCGTSTAPRGIGFMGIPKGCFGWLIRPPAASGQWSFSDAQRLGAQKYSVAVVLSVPSWWKSLELSEWTCWTGDEQFFSTTSALVPVSECKNEYGTSKQMPLVFRVRVPGSARDIAQKFSPQIVATPHVDQATDLAQQVLVAGQKGRLIFEGERLWKSPVVYVGDQSADEIDVLPNMQGIVATFNCVRLPSQYWTANNPQSGPVTIPTHIWTSEGRTASQPVTIVTPKMDQKDLPCAADSTDGQSSE